MRKRGLYDPKWSVVIYAVSRPLKSIAGALLRNNGIPKIISWLRQPRSDTWLQGIREMTVSFSDKDKEVIVKESARA